MVLNHLTPGLGGAQDLCVSIIPANHLEPEEEMRMEIIEIECICCGKLKQIPDFMKTAVFVCEDCEELHRENSARDQELEFELTQGEI